MREREREERRRECKRERKRHRVRMREGTHGRQTNRLKMKNSAHHRPDIWMEKFLKQKSGSSHDENSRHKLLIFGEKRPIHQEANSNENVSDENSSHFDVSAPHLFPPEKFSHRGRKMKPGLEVR